MSRLALADVLKAAMLGNFKIERLHFLHQTAQTILEGPVIQQDGQVALNASELLHADNSEQDDELFVEMLLPYMATLQLYADLEQRDWQAYAVLQQMARGGHGECVASMFHDLPLSMQWQLAYGYLDKGRVPSEQLFRRIVGVCLPNARLFVRNRSTEERKQVDWIIHVPQANLSVANHLIELAAKLILPFYHKTAVVGPEPPAILSLADGMIIGQVRLVDETL